MRPAKRPRQQRNQVWPHQEWADGMRNNPGADYQLTDEPTKYAAALAHRIREGLIAAYAPKGTFDAVARDGHVYGKFLEEA
ncbi:hypothetical protein LCGC14_0397020 [marine sediment metagenome]|uniref:Uncharacterized protein n=1 Tax=marine sediment metagenome TaxID=412755 RepID=A0A0F9T3E8_9ZZZZ